MEGKSLKRKKPSENISDSEDNDYTKQKNTKKNSKF
jgi:hypothetical protein